MAAGRIPVEAATRRKAVVAATIGNFVEWYDFIIYGYLATVIAAQFFPSQDPLAGILATFAVFGVSFLVRPWAPSWWAATATGSAAEAPSRSSYC